MLIRASDDERLRARVDEHLGWRDGAGRWGRLRQFWAVSDHLYCKL